MLTPKEGEKVGSLNGEITLPTIWYYFVLLVFITESLIKLHASGLGGNKIFFSQKHIGFYQTEMVLKDQKLLKYSYSCCFQFHF